MDNCGQFNAAAVGAQNFKHLQNVANIAGGATTTLNRPAVTLQPGQRDPMAFNPQGTPQQNTLLTNTVVNSNWGDSGAQLMPLVPQQQQQHIQQPMQQQKQPQQPMMNREIQRNNNNNNQQFFLPPPNMVSIQQQQQQMFQQQQMLQQQQQMNAMNQQNMQQYLQQQNQTELQQQHLLNMQQQQLEAQIHAQREQLAFEQQQMALEAELLAQQQAEDGNLAVESSADMFAMLRQQDEELQQQDNTATTTREGDEDSGFAETDDISQYIKMMNDNLTRFDAAPAQQQQQQGGLSQEHLMDMLNSSDERYKNSKVLNFLNSYHNGDVQFTEDDVVYGRQDENEEEQDELDDEDGVGLTHEEALARLMGQYQQDDHDYLTGAEDGEEWQEEWKNYWQRHLQEGGTQEEIQARYDDLQEQIQQNLQQFTTAIPNAYERGVELFEKGEIPGAIELFLNCLAFDPNHALAFMYLGKSYAQLDQDTLAINALQKCVDLDPYNLDALLLLGVSTSNNYTVLANSHATPGQFDHRNTPIQYLYTWMTNHPDYATTVDTNNVQNLIDQISQEGPQPHLVGALSQANLQMFEDAQHVNPHDADLSTVLGVLYYINKQYENAIKSFTTAVKLKPENPELWNKLGAAIANSGKHMEAIKFYDRALKIRPNYLRAKINFATANYNLQLHHLSYPLFLQAILNTAEYNQNIFQTNGNTDSCPQPHLWPLLRQSFAMCGLDNMAQAAAMRDLGLLREAMKESGMNDDGSIQDGFLQPIRPMD